MKILFVGVFTEISTNVWQANAFEKLGWIVIRFDYREVANEVGIKKRDEMLVEICEKELPTITLFAKCNIMDVGVLKQCYPYSGAIVLWMPDGMASVNEELILKMKVSNYIFCAGPEVINVAKKYCDNVYKLHGGYNSEIHYPIDRPKIRDVCFIGRVHGYFLPYREKLWQEKKFEVINGVYGFDHSKVVSETKINLNLTDGNGVSNRIFKLLASKGFVLTNSWKEMYDEFTPGKDFDVFHTLDELCSQIKFYLINENQRKKIAEHGYRTVQKYNDLNFAKKIIEMTQ